MNFAITIFCISFFRIFQCPTPRSTQGKKVIFHTRLTFFKGQQRYLRSKVAFQRPTLQFAGRYGQISIWASIDNDTGTKNKANKKLGQRYHQTITFIFPGQTNHDSENSNLFSFLFLISIKRSSRFLCQKMNFQ